MKTTFLSLILTAIFGIQAFGQNLEELGSVDGFAYFYKLGDDIGYAATKDENFYFYDAETFEVEFDLEAPKQDGMTFRAFYLVDRFLIDTDYQIEYFVSYVDDNSGDYVTFFYSDEAPQRFNSISSVTKVAINGEYKIAMSSITNNKTYFFEANGNPPTPVEDPEHGTTQTSAYPNPASNFVNLTYKLPVGVSSGVVNVFNSSGQLVESMQVGEHFNMVRLNVATYAKGVYYYQINGVTNQFIVE